MRMRHPDRRIARVLSGGGDLLVRIGGTCGGTTRE
jgi:hypothetical protein